MEMKILKKKLKISSFLKKQRVTFYEGIKGYHYHKKIWETQLDDFNIEHTNKEVRQLAIRDYIKAKIEVALLILLYFIIISLVIIILIKPISILFERIDNVTSYINIYLRDVSNDAWLGFWGSVLGSIVTMFGIIITIRFERKKTKLLENSRLNQYLCCNIEKGMVSKIKMIIKVHIILTFVH